MTARRREFLAILPVAVFSTVAAVSRAIAAEDVLHALKGEDLERLRLDFNASRSKVRLLLILSPT